MLDDADHFADILHGGLPYCLLIALPIILFCTPAALASDFQVSRMAQFDVNGVNFGCRASAISLEAKSLYSWSTARHCVLARLLELTVSDFNRIRLKAGGLIVLLPENVQALNEEEKEHVNLLEQAMLTQTVPVPVYFASYKSELNDIVSDLFKSHDTSKHNETALGQLFSSISGNGYQVTVSGANSVANKNSKIAVIQGELLPNQFVLKPMDNNGDFDTLPVIVITANLKTFGIYNDYPLNADAAILMVLQEIFSKLHSSISTTPKYRLVFLLSEGGVLLNFPGVRKWQNSVQENAVLQNVEFVLCLDTITPSLAYNDGNVLYMHVSKPPKEKSSTSDFFKLLKTAAGHHLENVTVEGVHKKINLADRQLAWEHEYFSMLRYPAFTLSAVKSPRSAQRYTMFNDDEQRIVAETLRSAKIIAEALAGYMYDIDEQFADIFDGDISINEELLLPYMEVKSLLHNSDIKDGFEKYLKNVKIVYDKADAREPDFMFYDGHEGKMNVYRVKPAVFDLFLTLIIALYLSAVYFVLQYFPNIYDLFSKFTKTELAPFTNGHYGDRVKAKVN